MDETKYKTKSQFKDDPEAEKVRTAQVFGSPSQTQSAEPKPKEKSTEIEPGDVHSALGLHDPSNGGVQLEGEVQTKVNEDTEKTMSYPDRPAGWPVLKQEAK